MAADASVHPKTGRLGTQARAELMEAYGARGHHRSALWLVFSPKASADVVLRSDLEFGHFLLVESDPRIVGVDYSAQKRVASIHGEYIGTIVDAEITLRTGAVLWREVKPSDQLESTAENRAAFQILAQAKVAGTQNVVHQVMTEKEIYARPQRIHNALRVVPWLAQARFWSLIESTNLIACLLNARGDVLLEEIFALGPKEEAALLGAAAFRGVFNGVWQSDLDIKPLGLRTRLYLEG